MQEITLKRLCQGEKFFVSRGWSKVVIHRPEPEESLVVKIPISTERISSVLDEVSSLEPTLPLKFEVLSDAECEEQGKPKGSKIQVEDVTDTEYVKQKFLFAEKSTYAVVLGGLDLSRFDGFEDAEGNKITTAEACLDVLMQAGLSRAQLNTIASDIRELHSQNLEKTDFLSEKHSD